jgi:hypothetical protein
MLAMARAMAALCALIGRLLARRSGTPEKLSGSEPTAAAAGSSADKRKMWLSVAGLLDPWLRRERLTIPA